MCSVLQWDAFHALIRILRHRRHQTSALPPVKHTHTHHTHTHTHTYTHMAQLVASWLFRMSHFTSICVHIFDTTIVAVCCSTFSTLQCIAVRCSVLQYVAVSCSVVRCSVFYLFVYNVSTKRNTLQHTATHCNTLQHTQHTATHSQCMSTFVRV